MNKDVVNFLAEKGKDLQMAGVAPLVSFGQKNHVLNFVEEAAKAQKFGFSIDNDTVNDVTIVIGGIGAGRNNTIFADNEELLDFVGADCILGDGEIFSMTPVGSESGKVTVTSTDSKRSVNKLIRYMSETPTRFTKFSMRSRLHGSNEKDSSNYDNKMKHFWASPLEDTVSVDLDMVPLQIGGNNFNTDMLDIDFQTQAQSFKLIASNENFNVIQVNAGTKLTITADVGAQLSLAQLFYRLISKVDDIMAPARRSI